MKRLRMLSIESESCYVRQTLCYNPGQPAAIAVAEHMTYRLPLFSTRPGKACCALSLAIWLLAIVFESHAADRFWSNPNGGTFTNSSNWQNGLVALSNDVAHFGTSVGMFQNAYTVTTLTNTPNQGLSVDGDNVTFNLLTHTYSTTGSVSIGTQPHNVFSTGDGELTIINGIFSVPFQSSMAIGAVANSTGVLTVSTGGQLIGNPFILVGAFGSGTMTVQNGGKLLSDAVQIGNSPTTTGTATITGAGSALVTVSLVTGNGGPGTLNILAGGQVESNSGVVANLSGGSGTVTVDGANSKWTNSGDFMIGKSGAGTLNITTGGRVQNKNGFLGDGSTGTGTVSGAGSQWVNSGVLQVGLFGQGFLEITAGGHVQDINGNIGGTNHSGQVTVSGAGSTWNSGAINVGFGGLGQLTIETGGSVSSTGASIGTLNGSAGTATLTGVSSAWTNSGNLTVGDQGTGILKITSSIMSNTGSLTIGNTATGTLTITQGANVSNTGGHVGVSAGVSGAATVDGANSKWINSGELSVGESGSGTLTITSGGIVQNTNGFINGIATVDGGTSQWINSGILQVGLSRSGTLNITGGAHVQSNGGNIAISASSNSTAKVSGVGSTWASSSGAINVGLGGTGELTIDAGASMSSAGAVIGSIAGSNGTVSVTDAASIWTNNGSLSVGDQGMGTLTITSSSVSNTDSLTVGTTGTGTLKVTQGASVSSSAGHIGVSTNSTGKVTVDSANSKWTNSGELRVGESGSGTLNIVAGGSVQNANCFISSGAGAGIANITGATSQWINSGILQVGLNGPGTLNITGGAHVQSNGSNIAISASSNSTAKVSGIGSLWTDNGILTVGLGGAGQLTIEQGGGVSSSSAFLGSLSGSNGTTTVSGAGSIWNVSGRLSIGGDASTGTNGGVGTLRIQPGAAVSVAQDTQAFNGDLLSLEGGTLSTSEIDIHSGTFQWTSGTLHVGIYHGSLTNPNGGVLAPGNSPGKSTVAGNYTQQAGATLQMELGGTSAGVTHDLLNVSGNVSLGGQLQLALLNGFVPSPGNTFTVMQAFGVSGAFSNVAPGQRLMTIDGLGSFIVNYGPLSVFRENEIVLSNFSVNFHKGDFNRDGHADASDITAMLAALTDLNTFKSRNDLSDADLRSIGDIDGSGAVTNADINALIGLLRTGGGSLAPVPEPTSNVLIVMALPGIAFAVVCRRGRSSQCRDVRCQ
jgi:T5SS/PEP-CTERM-associated repeat protein